MKDLDTIAEELRYSIWDPAGNITALVESDVRIEDQPSAAAKIMERHPEIEQVGFVRFSPESPEFQVQLRMAGGEFCGNASMSAAALYILKYFSFDFQDPIPVKLRVSGASDLIFCLVEPGSLSTVNVSIRIPEALSIRKEPLSVGRMICELPVVRMEGISHIVVTPRSDFYSLLENRGMAEETVKNWCVRLAADGLGIMFYNDAGDVCKLDPLVYVPACGTTFWENSCASGTAAVGMWLSDENASPVSLTIREPGGCIRVNADRAKAETFLNEEIRFLVFYPGVE